MTIKIQLSDAVYKALLTGQNRIQGSIGLVNTKEGNFNVHHRKAYVRPDMKFIQLPHGRASVTDERVSLTLHIDRHETDIVPHVAIDIEAQEASDFVYEQTFSSPRP